MPRNTAAIRRVSACQTTITAMEIIVDNSSYPTDRIAENSYKFRPLGLGFANLGALLMSRSLPYDSEPGRAYAAGGYTYALGSNQNMGLWNVFVTNTLKQTSTNYYVIGTCP